jgi:hypothetical protein
MTDFPQGYESPSVTDLGAFEELTQSAVEGKPNEKAEPATGT